MSFRYAAGINKPGFNPLAPQTPSYTFNLYSWGYNAEGQLGLGNTTNYSSPKQVGALTNWSVVVGNNNALGHNVTQKTDGTLWTWGSGGQGQLGLGNGTSYSSPKQVGALTSWITLNKGGNQTFGIK